jgi:K+-sensing histidine kinase KdpD
MVAGVMETHGRQETAEFWKAWKLLPLREVS